MIDETLPEIPAEDSAFLASKKGAELFSQELAAWSPARIVAAQSMGMRFPAIGREGQMQFEATGLYAGMLQDVIIHCWLRSLRNASEQTAESIKRGEWNVQRTLRSPGEAMLAALAWADEHQLCDVNTDAFSEAQKIFLIAMGAVEASKFEPASGDTTGQGTADPNV